MTSGEGAAKPGQSRLQTRRHHCRTEQGQVFTPARNASHQKYIPRRAEFLPDNWTYRRRRIPRITPPLRISQIHRRTVQLDATQVTKKPTDTLPQSICARRSRRPNQTDQQSEHLVTITVHDGLVRTDQHPLIRKPRTELSQLTQKPTPGSAARTGDI